MVATDGWAEGGGDLGLCWDGRGKGGKLAEGCSLVVHLCRATSIHALWVNAMWSFYSFKIVGCLNNEG